MNAPVSELCITTIHGKQYDVSKFVCKHPGGRTAIMLAHNQDATELFESYHVFSEVAHKRLDMYAIERRPGRLSVAAKQHMNDPFYKEVAKRVKKHFEEKELVVTASKQGMLIYVAKLVSYFLLYVFGFLRGSWLALGPFILMAWFVAGIGHDGAHFQVASSELVNNLGGMCIGTISGPWRWYWQHTVGHHVNTNQYGKDPDLHHYNPVMRVHTMFPFVFHHKYQQFYAPLIWMFLGLALSVFEPLLSGASKTNQDGIQYITVNRWTQLPWALLWHEMHIIWYIVAHFLLPMLCGMSVGKAILFGVLYAGGTGFLFALGSQVNHLNEDSMKAAAGDTLSWAAGQVETSIDFARDSPLTFALANGLNFQIEHHLFPSVNHEHLRGIAPIVEATCKEFGVKYKKFPSFFGAMREHVRFLAELGVPQEAPKSDEQPFHGPKVPLLLHHVDMH